MRICHGRALASDFGFANRISLMRGSFPPSPRFFAAKGGQSVSLSDGGLAKFLETWSTATSSPGHHYLASRESAMKLFKALSSLACSVAKGRLLKSVDSFAPFIIELQSGGLDTDALFKPALVGKLPEDANHWPEIQSEAVAVVKNIFRFGTSTDTAFVMKKADGETIDVPGVVVAMSTFFCHLGQYTTFLNGYNHSDGASTSKIRDFVAHFDTQGHVFGALEVMSATQTFIEENIAERTQEFADAAASAGKVAVGKFIHEGLKSISTQVSAIMADLRNKMADNSLIEITDVVKKCRYNGMSQEQAKKLLAAIDSEASTGLYKALKEYDVVKMCLDTFKKQLAHIVDEYAFMDQVLVTQEVKDACNSFCDEASKDILLCAGVTMGNITALQAMFRPLNVGETRPGLIKKFTKMLEKTRWVTVDEALSKACLACA